jgi:HK97 family phage portal protein
MSFLERLPTAFRYALSGKTAFDVQPIGARGQAVYPIANFESNVKSGYRRNELIYTCISLKADSAASARLTIRAKGGKEIKEHPLLDLLNRPNPDMTMFDFVGAVLIHLDLAGCSYWEKVRSRAGRVVQLWPLRPDWVKPIQGKAGIERYEYHVPGLKPIPLPVRDVLAFRLYDPMDQYAGLSPVTVAARVGNVDNSATDFIKNTFEQGGMPFGVLTSKNRLHDSDITRIRAGWRERYGGYKNWQEPAVLDSDATYQRTGMTMQELGFEVLDARSEARICAVLKVPPILVGAKIGLDRSTYSNYEEARRAFWQDGLMPQYKRIEDELQSDLAEEYGGDIDIDWDLTEVPALQQAKDLEWARAKEQIQLGAITVNEWRQTEGLKKFSEGDKRVPLLDTVGGVTGAIGVMQALAMGAMEVESAVQLFVLFFGIEEEEARAIVGDPTNLKPMLPTGSQPGSEEEADGKPVDEDAKKPEAGKKSGGPDHPPDEAERRKHERAMEREAAGFLEAQLARVKEVFASAA